MRISDGVFLLDGAEFDSNVYFIHDTLIDCGSGFFFKETKDQMKRFGIKPASVKKIILTHAHFDHVGAVADFKKLTGAEVLVHEKDAEVLRKGEVMKEDFEEITGEKIKFSGFEPDGLLKEGDSVGMGSLRFDVMHTPGHTPGSVSLWCPAKKMLVSGDLLFCDGFGRHDFPGGSPEELNASLARVKVLNPMMLLPGHGMPVDAKNKYSGRMLKNILDAIGK